MFQKTPEVHQQERIDRQIRFARDEINRHHLENKIIVYADETMFTRQNYQKMEYSPKNTNVVVNDKDFNIATVAFLGGVAEGLGLLHYEMFKRSVDIPKFLEWVDAIDFAYRALPRNKKKSGYVSYLD